MAYFGPEWVAQFAPESVAHFGPEWVVQFGPEYARWDMGTFVLLLLVFLFFYDTSMFKLVLGIIVLHAFLGEHND